MGKKKFCVEKKFGSKKCFGSKIFLAPIKFEAKKFWSFKNLCQDRIWIKKKLGQKNLCLNRFSRKKFWVQKNLDQKNILGQKLNFCSKNLGVHKRFLVRKNFWVPRNFGLKKFFVDKNIILLKFFGTKCFFLASILLFWPNIFLAHRPN